MSEDSDFKVSDYLHIQLKPGWTKKGINEFLKEAEKREILYTRARRDDMEKAIAQFRSSALNFIARLPSEIRSKPYFDCINQYNKDTGANLLDQLVSEVKKRSRLEWEDSVKTRTGKRPCRGHTTSNCRSAKTSQASNNPQLSQWPSMPFISEDGELTNINGVDQVPTLNASQMKGGGGGGGKRLPIASTPKVTELEGFIPQSTTYRVTRSRAINNQGSSTCKMNTTRVTNTNTNHYTTTNDTLTTMDKTLRPNSTQKLSKDMRDKLLSKIDRNNIQLSSPEAQHLRNLIVTLQDVLDRHTQSRRK
ncbi:hypothetical protein Smp_154940 [Schistosoma mansoni]|uniref:hypothetical protein n=1 Tax=Schistosoma mansoni TaxID=6183 RepID=UPI00022DCA13|nr:hypothetical protein Smp_154940 [Schistosoma mansoni]|eukprot:XP_018654482.1 hypothetical protein Smp_154940 [Schistosoma mansoni]